MLSYTLGTFYYSSSVGYRKIMATKYPPEIMLLSMENLKENLNQPRSGVETLPEDLIKAASDVSHITGYNTNFWVNAQPKNFKNEVTFREKGNFTALPPTDLVEIQADLFSSRNPLFTSGQAVLISGHFPDESNSSVLVENTLADANHLTAGDRISFDILQGNVTQTVDLPVVGIYRLTAPVEMVDSSGVHNSPSSVLFISYSTMQSFPKLNSRIDNVEFYVDSYDNAEQALAELKQLDFDHQAFTFVPSTPIPVTQLVKSMDMVNHLVVIILMIFVLLSMIIFILLLALSLRNYYYEVISGVTQPYAEGSLLTTFEEQRNMLQAAFQMDFVWTDILLVILFIFLILLIFMAFARGMIQKVQSRRVFSKGDL